MSFSFRPVQGTDAQIHRMQYSNGYLYFATDSGKIYLDANDQNKLLMGGGGTAVLYANDTTVIERPDGAYSLSIDTLEDSSKIKEDDLIINQGDSCFYKVKIINWNSNEIICSRIAVSGTGGGPSGPSVESKLSIDEISGIASRMTFVYGQSANITLKITAQDDSVVTVVYEIVGNNNRKSYETEVVSGDYTYFDIGSKLYEGTNKVNIQITSNNSGSDARSYDNLSAVKLAMTPLNINNSKIIDINERVINISLTGSNLQKQVNAYIDNIPFYTNTNAPASVAITLPGARLPLNQDGSDPNVLTKRQAHGVHEVKITMSAIVGGKTISVPDLSYEFAWVESNVSTPIIWFNKTPTSIINYSVAEVEYQVYDPTVAEGREFQIKVLKNGDELAESPKTVMYKNDSYLTWYISNYDLGHNEYSIDRNGTTRTFSFNVEADSSRDMEIQTSNLYLSLDSSGRSNNEVSYNRNKWTYKNSNNREFSATLSGFNWYNNGWIENEETKIAALRISNGATLSIPIGQNILNTSALEDSLTFEFQFKIHNVQNYVTMVATSVGEGDETGEDKDNDGIIDKEIIDTSRIRENWDSIAFADFYSQGVGFAFGPSDFFMAGGSALAYARYKEDEMINISIVINRDEGLIYLYINGVLSQIKKCDVSKNFYNNSSNLRFYPTTCDIDLYKVRIYNSRALSYADVVHNMLADLKDTLTYDANQITEVDAFGNQTIMLNKLQTYNINNPDNPSMPYAILKINDTAATKLPYYKGNAVTCDVTFINPALDRAYATGELSRKAAAAGVDVKEYYLKHCPSFHKIGASVDVQGTSSQGYPRRNYKLKCGTDGSWVAHKGPFEESPRTMTEMYLDNARGEATFTWKADYMESSGSHNTGLTSYVKTLYSKHPLADYYDINTINNYEDLRTTIYGFPMLVFEEKQDGTYEFIGKYNFNLDKDCPTVTGMNYNQPHPYVAGKAMKDVCECWEMCNNKGTRTAFKQMDYDEIVGEVTNQETGEVTTDYTLTVTEDIEYRYLAESKKLKKLLEDPGYDNNLKALEYYQNIKDLAEWLYYLDTTPSATADNAFGANVIPSGGITYNGVTYTEDNKEYRLAKFKAEFEDHMDLEYTLIYFIVTELLVLYDSRGKNMMLASWGPQKQGGNYIWYPIFYDVDTQLGIDNSGVPLWDYDVNPSDDRVFSTPGSVLWNNFYTTFLTQIKNKYHELRGGGDNAKLSFNRLNGYYDFNSTISGSYAMSGIRPYVAYNADAFYKYIAPAKAQYGYITTEGKTAYTDTYYYCAQGTRELQRELFLNNRFYYLDSRWQAGAFDYNNISASTQTRINSNDGAKTSDTVWKTMENLPDGYEYPNEHDTLNYFNITPFLNSYTGFYIDSSFITSGQVTKSGETVQINLPPTISTKIIDGPNDNQGQLVYLSGKKYTSSYGDLSRYYLNEIDLSDANKLTDILVGSDVDGYRNDYFTKDAKIVFDQTNGYPLLKEANFSRLASFNAVVDLTKSEKLENFRAVGSAITEAKFANGVQLRHCSLPRSIDTLKFIEARNLSSILNQFPRYNAENKTWPTGLYVEGLTNKLDKIKSKSVQSTEVATNIATIYFNQVGMKYDSFLLLEGLMGIKNLIANEWKDNKNLSKRLSVNMLNVNWSPYEKVEAGAPYNSSYNYYTPTDQYTFTLYDISTNTWDKDTRNGKVYTKRSNETSPIVDLSILDMLIEAYEASQTAEPEHTFYGTVEGTIGYISGSLYVQNDEAHPISAFEIQNKYLRYFPELTIYAEYTTPALSINYVEENAEGVLTTWETQKYLTSGDLTANIAPIAIVPTKTHYDFLGWSLTKNATTPDAEQPTDYTVAELKDKATNNTITFWAVYTIHKYKITFYNYDGSSLTDEPESKVLEIPANTSLYEPNDIIPYRDPPEGKYQIYNFQGYSFNRNNIGPKVDLTSIKATKDLVFYAYYGNWVDVREVIHPEYFTAASYSFIHDENSFTWGDPSKYSNMTGVQLSLVKPIKGKITIPAMYNGYPVVALDSSFSAGQQGYNLTHVFFESGSEVRALLNQTFENNISLIEVEFPASLRRIHSSCFSGCSSLKLSNNTLGGNIAFVGERAFLGAFDSSVSEVTLGSSIIQMDYYAFANLNTVINNLYIGSSTNPSQLILERTSSSTHGQIIFSCTSAESAIENAYIYTGGRYTHDKFLQYVRGGHFNIAQIDSEGG